MRQLIHAMNSLRNALGIHRGGMHERRIAKTARWSLIAAPAQGACAACCRAAGVVGVLRAGRRLDLALDRLVTCDQHTGRLAGRSAMPAGSVA